MQKRAQDRKTHFETVWLPVAKILSPVARQAPTKAITLDFPIRGAQFAADRIAPIRSDLKSHDSNRNPKFRSIRSDVFTTSSNVWEFIN